MKDTLPHTSLLGIADALTTQWRLGLLGETWQAYKLSTAFKVYFPESLTDFSRTSINSTRKGYTLPPRRVF